LPFPQPLKRSLQAGLQLLRSLLLRVKIARFTLTNRFGASPVVRTGGPVVSLTTHGHRINSVHLAIESIAHGSLLPSRLILWLDDEKLFGTLQSELRRLQARGLEVKLSKGYGPHTKYYPYVESEAEFKVPLATADDDILYPKHWLRRLVHAFEENSEVVNCCRARVVSFEKDKIAPYSHWHMCRSVRPSFLNFATGVSGVIYPPRFLEALKQAGTAFEDRCPKADDIWLHAQALRTGHRIRQIQHRPVLFPRLPGTQEDGLKHGNVMTDGGNDRQASRTYTESDVQIMRSHANQHSKAEPRHPDMTVGQKIRTVWHAVIYGALTFLV
jgi:hypothetical protein